MNGGRNRNSVLGAAARANAESSTVLSWSVSTRPSAPNLPPVDHRRTGQIEHDAGAAVALRPRARRNQPSRRLDRAAGLAPVTSSATRCGRTRAGSSSCGDAARRSVTTTESLFTSTRWIVPAQAGVPPATGASKARMNDDTHVMARRLEPVQRKTIDATSPVTSPRTSGCRLSRAGDAPHGEAIRLTGNSASLPAGPVLPRCCRLKRARRGCYLNAQPGSRDVICAGPVLTAAPAFFGSGGLSRLTLAMTHFPCPTLRPARAGGRGWRWVSRATCPGVLGARKTHIHPSAPPGDPSGSARPIGAPLSTRGAARPENTK